MERQGFYFYRHNRLVQAGGWNNFRQPDQHLALTRISIDLPDDSRDVFRLSVKKEGVEMSPEVVVALEDARDGDGRLFTEYLTDGETTYREARKTSGTIRKPVIPPGKGIDASVRETIEEELPLIPGEDPISVRWQTLDNSAFFELDRENRTIHLNQNYRAAILGGRKGTLNDAPLLKSLMYLLLHQLFEKEYSGKREKDNLQLWQAVMVSAARAELERVADGE